MPPYTIDDYLGTLSPLDQMGYGMWNFINPEQDYQPYLDWEQQQSVGSDCPPGQTYNSFTGQCSTYIEPVGEGWYGTPEPETSTVMTPGQSNEWQNTDGGFDYTPTPPPPYTPPPGEMGQTPFTPTGQDTVWQETDGGFE